MAAAIALALSACAVGSSSVYDVKPGDCFDDPPTSEASDEGLTALPTVDCDEPHDNEVFATFAVADGPFPGVEALDGAARTCVPLFEDYVGSPIEDVPELDVMWLIPTLKSWNDGYRTVICALSDAGPEQLTGSQRAAGS